jgi:hypothetical protein
VAELNILQELPEGVVIKKSVLVGSFKDDLGWPNRGGLFEKPLDFNLIKSHCKEFLFIHSGNDPDCPLEHAEYLSRELNGTLKIMPGHKHLS